VAPDVFNAWATRNGFSTSLRIIQLDGSPNFAPHTLPLTGSDQIAQYVASDQGRWTIAYDEFGYAKVYGAPAAWVQNESGNYVQPFAQNIASALTAAQLRPDLSQELSGVYVNPAADAYPISAYSYVVTQCNNPGDRPTCKGTYSNGGITETFEKWLRYIACDGQVNMARIGYSPLPTNLSQEISNSIARIDGKPAEQLNAGNCANPTFSGSLGADSQSPGDPLSNVASLGGTSGSDAAAQAASTAGPTADNAAAAAAASSGKAGSGVKSANGGSKTYRNIAPVVYTHQGIPTNSPWPLIAFLAVLALPPVVVGIRRLRRRDA
jgi:phosphate transport system substrate-binding protein